MNQSTDAGFFSLDNMAGSIRALRNRDKWCSTCPWGKRGRRQEAGGRPLGSLIAQSNNSVDNEIKSMLWLLETSVLPSLCSLKSFPFSNKRENSELETASTLLHLLQNVFKERVRSWTFSENVNIAVKELRPRMGLGLGAYRKLITNLGSNPNSVTHWWPVWALFLSSLSHSFLSHEMTIPTLA